MGCGTSKAVAVEDIANNTNSDPVNGTRIIASKKSSELPSNKAALFSEAKAPVAFEIAGSDEQNSIINAHPPKRFRRLEDGPELSQEEINKRKIEAEQRRKAILEQRVQSARNFTARAMRRTPATPIMEEAVNAG